MLSKINIYQSNSQVVRDAVDKVVVQIYRKKREQNHRAFLITGCNTGCGTTYTAINMSVALANAGWRTVLVDCDIRKGMEYKRLNQTIDYGLSDYLIEGTKLPIFNTNYEKMDYIPCGNDKESPVRLLCTKKMEDLAEELKKSYDFIIYDFPSINLVPDAGILIPVVDDVILVAAINETGKKQLESAKKKVKAHGNKYMGMIANKIDIAEYGHYVKNFDYFGKNQLRKKYSMDMKKRKHSEAEREEEKNEKED